MSTIGGIFYPDSAPLEYEALQRFCTELELRGGDSTDVHNVSPITLVHCRYITHPFNREEQIEHSDKSGKYLAWDGRLDNRGDISRALSSHLNIKNDSLLVLKAIERWGPEFTFKKIVGDWALAFWDSRERTVYLARDYAGARPLYYSLWNKKWIWASDIDAILKLSGYTQEINIDYLSGLFSVGADITITPYRGIYAVPPGSYVKLNQHSQEIFYYWDYSKIERIRYRSNQEYEEQYRYFFKAAVRRRVNSNGVACAHLSGGLDSSSIICLADQLIVEDSLSTKRLETISHIYDESESGERSFIEEVESRRQQPGNYLRIKDHHLLEPLPLHTVIPCFSNAFWKILSAQSRLVTEIGSRVLISGIGGDEITGNTRNAAAFLIRQLEQGELRGWIGNLSDWSRVQRRPLWNIILETVNEGGRHFNLRSSSAKCAPWLTEKVRSYEGAGNSRLSKLSIGFASSVSAIAHHQHRIWCGSEISYPYLDRDFVYFCHSIPITQLIRPGESRSLMRRALTDLLPGRIINRRSKNLPARSLCLALENQYPRFKQRFGNLVTAELGLISPDLLLPAIQRMRHGTEEFIGALVMLIVIEEWLQGVTYTS